MTWLAITWIINEYRPGSYPPLHQRPLLIYSLAGMLFGLQMLTMGFLAELFTAHSVRYRDEFSIAETTDADASS
jgi:dolichol-phosphate mannosyltransferase